MYFSHGTKYSSLSFFKPVKVKTILSFQGHSKTGGGVLDLTRAPWFANPCFRPQKFVSSSFYFNVIYLYLWLGWVFVAARGLSLVAVSGGYSSLWCTGFSLRCLLLLWSTGSRRGGSVVVAHGLYSAGSLGVAHGLSCSTACGIFPVQGSNPWLLQWQADS